MRELVESAVGGRGIEIYEYDYEKKCGCGWRSATHFAWAGEDEEMACCTYCFLDYLVEDIADGELVVTEPAAEAHA